MTKEGGKREREEKEVGKREGEKRGEMKEHFFKIPIFALFHVLFLQGAMQPHTDIFYLFVYFFKGYSTFTHHYFWSLC